MVTLVNTAFKNKSLVTSWGKIEFSAEGVAEVEDIVGEKLSKLTGFSLGTKVSTPDDENDQKNKNMTLENQNMASDKTETISDNQEDESQDDETTITAEELDAMNVPQLKKYAKEAGIDVANLSKKQELIDAILAK